MKSCELLNKILVELHEFADTVTELRFTQTLSKEGVREELDRILHIGFTEREKE